MEKVEPSRLRSNGLVAVVPSPVILIPIEASEAMPEVRSNSAICAASGDRTFRGAPRMFMRLEPDHQRDFA